MDANTWVAIGSAAGAAGFALAGYTFAVDRLAGRKADIEARGESYQVVENGRARTETVIVIENHGPAQARDVEIKLAEDKEAPSAAVRIVTDAKVPILWPRQRHEMWIVMAWGGGTQLTPIDVGWKDGRLRRQTRAYWLSFQRRA